MRQGRIEVICGPMFSGKTSELVRRLKRLDHAKKKYLVVKPRIDGRSGPHEVVTHENVTVDAVAVSCGAELLEQVEFYPYDIVAIDEAQFFEAYGDHALHKICSYLREQGMRVIVNGLDMDSFGEPFGAMPLIMSVADEVLKLKSVCACCGEDATMTFRKTSQQDTVVIGGLDEYEPRCVRHWTEGNLRAKEVTED